VPGTNTTSLQAPSGASIRVLVVDDHPIVRHGVARLVSDHPGLIVSGEAASAVEALDQIRERPPDVVLLDLSLAGGGGLTLIREMKALHEGIAIVVLSVHEESLHAERALAAGAIGYVMKHEATDRIVDAVRCAKNGEIYLSESMKSRLLLRFRGDRPARTNPLDKLSDRELEVFHWIGRGHSPRQTADALCLSTKTIETHLEHMKTKLGLLSGRELSLYAMRWSLSDS